MGLNDIKSRNESMGKKSRGSFLKVNKYENHKMALDLVAHICTESRVIDISPHFEEIHRLVNEMKEKKKAEGFAFSNEDFLSDILEESRKMKEDLLNNVSSSLKIAVTGGYSSGKSSLLNTITNIDDKLPTGIEPVSVVNTYLNCSNSVKDLIIKGENLKNALVSLDEEVLGCIRHSSKSKVYIASVLNKLILDIPVEKTPSLDGVTFIDTPGYNNSKNKNKENDRTDCDTAINAFEEANVIFWCIDIEAGTITQKDMEMIKKAGNKPVVIVFTKIDKKPMEEVKKIINNASALCRKELKYQPKEIIGFSCVDKNNEGYSLIAKTISGFKNQYKTDFRNFYSDKIKDLFKAEIEASENRLKQYEATRQELIKQKDEYHKQRRSLVQDSNDYYEKEPVISIASKSYNGAVPNDVQPQDNWNYWKDRMNYLERERGRLESYGHHSNNQVWELKRQYDQAEFNYHRLYSSSNAGSQYKEQAQAKPVQDQVIRDRESRVEEIERLLEFWKAQMDDYRNSIAIYENVRRKRPHERDYWSERISALTSLYKDAESNCYRLSSNAGFQYKEQAQAKQVQNQIIRDRESPVEGMERDLKQTENKYKDILSTMQKEEECKRFLKEYSPKVSDEFRTACNRSIERLSQYMNELQSLKATTEEENIFYAIRMNNMNDFLSCFSRKKGVDLTQCNEDGFSPLTWTVKTGNTEMIKFFIDHKEEIDLSQKDRLGYNAFETAVICHNQNICELLLSADQSLARGCSRSLRDLAKENNFENWIAQLN